MADKPAIPGSPSEQTDTAGANKKFLDEMRTFDSKACIRCHPPRESGKLTLSPLDFGQFDFKTARTPRKDVLELLAPTIPTAAPESPELKDARLIAKFQAAEPLEKSVAVLSRLPEKMAITFGTDNLSLKTDFIKLIEAVPGAKLDDNCRKIFGSIEQLSLKNNLFTLDLKNVVKLPLNMDVPLLGKVTDLSFGDVNKQTKFDIAFDAKNPDKVSLKNISGISLDVAPGKTIAIKELGLDTSGDKPRLSVSMENPYSKRLPDLTLSFSLDSIAPGLDGNLFKGLVRTLADSKSALQNKDASMLLSGLPDETVRVKLQEVLKGIVAITKDGDTFRITRNNGVTEHDFGGPKLSIAPTLTFQVGKNADCPAIRNLTGVEFSVPLPSELRLGSFKTALTEVGLGPNAADGRTITVRTNNVIDSVSLKLNKDMQPHADAEGNWSFYTTVRNPLGNNPSDKLTMCLRVDKSGQLNMKASEIADIVSRASAQGSKLSPKGIVLYGGSIITSGAGELLELFGK